MRQATLFQRFRWLILAIAVTAVWLPLATLRLLLLAITASARWLHSVKKAMFPPTAAAVDEGRTARLQRLETAGWTPEAIVREALEALKHGRPDPDLAAVDVAVDVNGARAGKGHNDYRSALNAIYAGSERLVSFRITGVSHFRDGHTDVTVNEEHRASGQAADRPQRQPPPAHGIVTVVYTVRQSLITAIRLRTLDPRFRHSPSSTLGSPSDPSITLPTAEAE